MNKLIISVLTIGILSSANAGIFQRGENNESPLRARLLERLNSRTDKRFENPEAEEAGLDRMKTSITPTFANVRYGKGAKELIDVYTPSNAANGSRPTIVMVHGGGWYTGDKSMSNVVDNKVKYFVDKQGWNFISVGNDLLPGGTSVSEQIDEVAQAVKFVQNEGSKWGVDMSRLYLMGHSAGAHLVMMLSSDVGRVTRIGGKPWRATVSLDSGGLDVNAMMEGKHFNLYDRAFGTDPNYWVAMSPTLQWSNNVVPTMLVCSTHRTESCPQAKDLKAKNASMNPSIGMDVLPLAKSHGAINKDLGEDMDYTKAVETWMQRH